MDNLDPFVREQRVCQGVGTVWLNVAVVDRGGNEGSGESEQESDAAQGASLCQDPAQVVAVAEPVEIRFDRMRVLPKPRPAGPYSPVS